MQIWRFGIFGLGIVTACPDAAVAAPLAPEICANLKSEIAEFEAKGVRASMTRGPETAKSTLTPEQLAAVRRLLDLDGQLLFRCARDRPYVALKPESTEELDTVEPGPDATAAAAAPTSVPAPAKPKARPKADDAYKPPVADNPVVTVPPANQ